MLPELIPLSDDGSSIFVEDDAHRYMPTRKIVKEGDFEIERFYYNVSKLEIKVLKWRLFFHEKVIDPV